MPSSFVAVEKKHTAVENNQMKKRKKSTNENKRNSTTSHGERFRGKSRLFSSTWLSSEVFLMQNCRCGAPIFMETISPSSTSFGDSEWSLLVEVQGWSTNDAIVVFRLENNAGCVYMNQENRDCFFLKLFSAQTAIVPFYSFIPCRRHQVVNEKRKPMNSHGF